MLLRELHLTSRKVILHVVTLLLPFPSSEPELWVKDGTETRKHGWPDLRTLMLYLSLGIYPPTILASTFIHSPSLVPTRTGAE